jgi:hypothetical protein
MMEITMAEAAIDMLPETVAIILFFHPIAGMMVVKIFT